MNTLNSNSANKRIFEIDTKLGKGTKIEFLIDKNEKPEEHPMRNYENLNS